MILTDEDLNQLPVATSHEIDVVEFVPSNQVDPILFAKTYYLEPDAKAAKPYALLREALIETERMAIVKVALRQKETLAVLRVRDKAILLQTMLWPDEIRKPDFAVLDADVELRPQELKMAASLVESMAADFEPEQFSDSYREAVIELIDAKLERGESAQLPAKDDRPRPARPARWSTCSPRCSAASTGPGERTPTRLAAGQQRRRRRPRPPSLREEGPAKKARRPRGTPRRKPRRPRRRRGEEGRSGEEGGHPRAPEPWPHRGDSLLP